MWRGRGGGAQVVSVMGDAGAAEGWVAEAGMGGVEMFWGAFCLFCWAIGCGSDWGWVGGSGGGTRKKMRNFCSAELDYRLFGHAMVVKHACESSVS